MQHKWIPAVLSCLALAAFPAAAQDQTKEAKIERILKLTNADAMIDQMFDQMKKMATSQMPAETSPEARAKVQELQGKTMDLIRTRLSWEKMRPAYV